MLRTFPHSMVSHTVTEHPKASDFERHCHNGYELLFVLHGDGSYIVEGTQYPLRSNTLMLLRPQEYHYVCPTETSLYERYVINFDASVPLDIAFDLPIMEPNLTHRHGMYFSSPELAERLLQVFRLLDHIALFSTDKHAAYGETLVRTAVTQALLFLSFEESAGEAAHSNELVTDVIDYLNRHLSEKLTLEDLAQTFFISKFYLCRTFRQYTGMPPMTYLNIKRMALAQQLLDQGIGATEVATHAGFGDYSSFYRAYCKQNGRPPSRSRHAERVPESSARHQQ